MSAYRVPLYPLTLTADGDTVHGTPYTVTEYAPSPWQARANLIGHTAGRGVAVGYAEAAK